MSYTPMEADEDYYLRATASYDDGHGSGKMAMATTTSTVTAADPLLVKYDTSDNGEFERGEVIAAITRYLNEEEGVTRSDVIEVITRYLSSS